MTWPNTHTLGGIALDVDDGSRVVTVTVGLDDSPEIRLSLDEKAQQDGLWDSNPVYGGRVVTIEGFAQEATSSAAHAFVASLRALATSDPSLIVTSPSRGVVSARVRVQAGITVQWIDDRTMRYAITLIAPDPLLYGPEVYATASLASAAGGTGLVYPLAYPLDYGVPPGTTPGAVSVGNIGTASYFPRLRITGPVTNPVVGLVETGDWVRVDRYIEAGQHVDINWGTPRRVTIGDNPVSIRHQVSSSGNFLAVPVGGGQITFAADDADPAASLSVWSFEGAWQ